MPTVAHVAGTPRADEHAPISATAHAAMASGRGETIDTAVSVPQVPVGTCSRGCAECGYFTTTRRLPSATTPAVPRAVVVTVHVPLARRIVHV